MANIVKIPLDGLSSYCWEGPGGSSVTKSVLCGGLSDGVSVVRVNSGKFSFTVILTRGMGIWRARTDRVELGWDAPVKGPVHPAFVNLADPSGLGWLDGFDEFLVRCGLESNGAPVHDDDSYRRLTRSVGESTDDSEDDAPTHRLLYPLHGKIANRPARDVWFSFDEDSGEISISGVVDERRLFFSQLTLTATVSTTVGRLGMSIADKVTNVGSTPHGMQLLYHINQGKPFLGPEAKVVIPVNMVVPRDAATAEGRATWDVYQPEQAGIPEECFYLDTRPDANGVVTALLQNPTAERGMTVKFKKEQLQCCSLWKNRHPEGYVTGVEPGTNFPNPRPFEESKGRVLMLPPGESRGFDLDIDIVPNVTDVSEAIKALGKIQGDHVPEIADRPVEGWSLV